MLAVIALIRIFKKLIFVMLFKDLVTRLKAVKSEKDINSEWADELLNAGIVSAVNLVLRDQPKASAIEAIEVARMTVLKHFDMIMMDAMLDEAEQDHED